MTTTTTEVPLPPMRLRLMREDDDRFRSTAADLARLVVAEGLPEDGAVLDVGCGTGRLAVGLLTATGFRGRYLGFDVMPKHVGWCAETLAPRFPSYEFRHLDVHNDRYNPKGTVPPEQARFPAETAAFDRVVLFSVFTHFYRADIERYLREIRRVLRPGGRAVTTWFLFDEARLPLVTSPTAGYPMVHRLDESTVYAEASDPLRAIAYDEALVRRLVAEAGLELVRVDRGTWTGEPGRIFQDLVVLERPDDVRERALAAAGRVRRRVLPPARRAVRRTVRQARRRLRR